MVKKHFGRQHLAIILLLISVHLHTFGQDYNPLFLIKQNGLFGYIQKSGEIAIEPIYSAAFEFNEGIAFVVKDNKPFFIDKEGIKQFDIPSDLVVTPICSEGMIAFNSPEGYGFLNNKGEIAIPPAYLEAETFSDNLALVRDVSTNKYGYINKKGQYKIAPQFDRANSFADALALVKKNNDLFYINTAGKISILPNSQFAYSFSEGVALIWRNFFFEYIDKEGDVIARIWAPQKQELYKDLNWAMCSDGLIAVYDNAKDKIGFVNKNLKKEEKENLAKFQPGQGKEVIAPSFQNVNFFTNGMARLWSGNKVGFINKKGETTIRCQFDDAKPFNNNLARVFVGGAELDFKNNDPEAKMGYINKSGEWIWEPSN